MLLGKALLVWGLGVGWLRYGRLFSPALACFLIAVGGARGVTTGAPRAAVPVAPELQRKVDFWKNVFAKYSGHEVVIHDSLDLRRVYKVLDFRPLARRGMSEAEIEQRVAEAVKREKLRIRTSLLRLHRTAGMRVRRSAEERRIAKLFSHAAGPRALLLAARDERVRAQKGMRENFAKAIEVAHRYFPAMEVIFRRAGVPVEVTRLALVESGFNVRAYSKRGAAGVWQFISSTGRRFLRIDDVVDERRDPFLASRAAARYLRENYDRLGEWPLAITAYNHGPAGIERAVRKLGTTDISQIVQHYESPSFGFASRNFYAEFLAALEVERNHRRYYGPLDLQRPRATTTVKLPDFVRLDTLAGCAGVEFDALAVLNPSLSRRVYDGKSRVPRGFALRLPAARRERFGRCYADLSPGAKFSKQRRRYIVHRVRRGQTLWAIARRYGTTVERIRRRNKLHNSNFIREGQLLRIPRG